MRKTIGNWRRQLETTREISLVDGPRVGDDGKVRGLEYVPNGQLRLFEESYNDEE